MKKTLISAVILLAVLLFAGCKEVSPEESTVSGEATSGAYTIALQMRELTETEQQALYEKIDESLQVSQRENGELDFEISKSLSVQEATDVIAQLGFSTDFENKEVYPSNGFRTYEGFETRAYYFTIRLPEEELRETLYKLLTCEQIENASPTYYETLS